MTEVLLAAASLIVGICGDRIMDRVDQFLNEHVTGGEEEDEQRQG